MCGWKIKILLPRIRLGRGENIKILKTIGLETLHWKTVVCQILFYWFIQKHLSFDTSKPVYFDIIFQIEKYSFETWLWMFKVFFCGENVFCVSTVTFSDANPRLAGMLWADFAMPGCRGKKLCSEFTLTQPSWLEVVWGPLTQPEAAAGSQQLLSPPCPLADWWERNQWGDILSDPSSDSDSEKHSPWFCRAAWWGQ